MPVVVFWPRFSLRVNANYIEPSFYRLTTHLKYIITATTAMIVRLHAHTRANSEAAILIIDDMFTTQVREVGRTTTGRVFARVCVYDTLKGRAEKAKQ